MEESRSMSGVVGVGTNHYAASLSTHAISRDAIAQICDELAAAQAGPPDLLVLFVSQHHVEGAAESLHEIERRLAPRVTIGCRGEGILGVGREVEEGPALSAWAAWLPTTQITPLRLNFERTPEGGAITGWPDRLVAQWPAAATVLLLADPFTFPADYLLERWNEDHPDTQVLGGMASGAARPGESLLFGEHTTLNHGAVGVVLHGGPAIRSLVSQGCRPIGEPFVVTRVERNLIHQLGGRPALSQLRDVFQRLPNHEQQAMQRGLHIGRVVSEYQDRFEMGDFLIRNVLGIDHETEAIAVGDYLRSGQTIQFHLRDEKTASDELRQLLLQHHRQHPSGGVLLFTCNGRGTRLFSQPDHDARQVAETLGNIPLAGFFAQGEIGPIGGKNFLHGFTASLALFS